MNSEKDENIELLSKVDDEISSKLKSQVESASILDGKSGIIIAANGFIIAGYVQALAEANSILLNYGGFVVLELVCAFLSIFFCVRSFVLNDSEKWRDDPDPRKLFGDYVKDIEGETKEGKSKRISKNITESKVKAYNHNQKLFSKKYLYIRRSAYLLMLSVVLLIIHFIFSYLKVEININF